MRRNDAHGVGSENRRPSTSSGFTFICGTIPHGQFLLKRKSRRDRMRAKLKEIKEELRRRMHRPIPEQGTWLTQVVSRILRVSRRADQQSRTQQLSATTSPPLAAHAPATQPEGSHDVAADHEAGRRLSPTSRASFIPGRASASPSNTQGGSRMREFGTSGSVRGAASNGRPYRDGRSHVSDLLRHYTFLGSPPKRGCGSSVTPNSTRSSTV